MVQHPNPYEYLQPGRNWNSDQYRFGFNGKENDNEVKGIGNQQDYGMRIYDPRLGRFLSTDPLIVKEQKYPWYSPYQFAGNKPILCVDVDGLEDVEYTVISEDMQTGRTKILLTAKPNTKIDSHGGQLMVVNSNTGHGFLLFPFDSQQGTFSGSSEFDQLFQINAPGVNPTLHDDSKEIYGAGNPTYSFRLNGSSPLMENRPTSEADKTNGIGIFDSNGNVKWSGSYFEVYPIIPGFSTGGSLDVTQSDTQILNSIYSDCNAASANFQSFNKGGGDVLNVTISVDQAIFDRIGAQLTQSLSSMFPNAQVSVSVSQNSNNSGAYSFSANTSPVDLKTL